MNKKFSTTLFIFYILAIVWIILFKLQPSIGLLPKIRDINLIPFYGEDIKSVTWYIRDLVYNMFVFVPFGIHIGMLRPDWSFVRKIAPIVLTSLAFELIQFAFSIGATDINDLIQNTLGGIVGIGVFYVFKKNFQSKSFLLINLLALVATIIFSILVGLMLFGFLRFRIAPY